MEKPRIVAAEHLNGDLVLIDFSDETEAVLTIKPGPVKTAMTAGMKGAEKMADVNAVAKTIVAAIDAKTMQSRKVPGLYFIGEVVDVTGWLGGYNFQWAWASGAAAGQSA